MTNRPIGTELSIHVVKGLPGVAQVVDLLGVGDFCHAFRCRLREKEEDVTVKLLAAGHCSRSSEQMADFVKLEHPNLVKIWRVIFGPPTALYSEVCTGGDLDTFFLRASKDNAPSIGMADRLAAACDIVNAASYLHSNLIVHGGIRPSHAYFAFPLDSVQEGLPAVKLGEPSMMPASRKLKHGIETLRYMAPELMGTRSFGVGFPCDVYSCGMLLYAIGSGQMPFSWLPDSSDAMYDVMRSGERPSVEDLIDHAASQDIGNIITTCCDSSPPERPSVEVLKERLNRIHSGQY